ncbi:SsrA-binding protein SmpB [Maridesulfovibrio hydrothermalis]|uniref:SsrA-binding protein n=1 Tax=Maridesulfovibrio hydrothermalis AM13 = DSM 14728 TaxID=1121451 RepID=L0R986_9BACT|nr:SsrA-binding protein SmpB [Maridesulfovibrio hydrothermalis]CCO22782.1 SsrA-binding protein [Maridesulfovibrio hydrothermalis AM13 = DSM 14728]
MAKKKKKSPSAIAVNKQARRNYDFTETLEAGLVLVGTEVKSLRNGQVSFNDGYINFKDGEAWLVGIHIAPYDHAGHSQHDPDRSRKLLLHSLEIEKLQAKSEQKGLTVIPVKLYFTRGKIKLQIALAKGKNVHSRKEELKRRDIARDTARQLANY